jgi:serine/threonine protein kinase
MSTDITQPPTPSKSSPRRTNALPSGYVLDEYRIDVILGAGGFGVTYKALDTHLERWVAIKEYFPVEWSFRDADGVTVYANTQGLSSASDGQTSDYEWGLERFLDEARVLARIQHPYVVRVKRYFRANGTAYIVMEYEEGEPLSAILDESKTLGEDQVRDLLDDVLPALQAVHEQGYLHRDIKPANLYVRASDHRVMLIDFGAARAAIGRHSQHVTSLVTPGYSPPEQYTTRNDRYGTWTDLYALGAVLYRCVIGHTPAEAAERLLDDHLESAVTVVGGRYSTNLLRVIDRALAVRPEMRFRDVAEMQAALASSRDDDSDETVIMAPVVRTGRPVQGTATRPAATRRPTTQPVAESSTDREGSEIARSAVESPSPVTQRWEVVPASPRATLPPSRRRAPLALLAGGTVALVALVVWLWPSAPAPEQPPPSPPSLDLSRQPVQPPVGLSPPVSQTSESATAPSGAPIAGATPAGALPVEPASPSAAPVEAGASTPPAVETTMPEPAPAAESGTLAPASEPPLPLLEPDDQTVQPGQFREEPTTKSAPESVTTDSTLISPLAPAITPSRARSRSDLAVEPATTKPDADKKSPIRKAAPARSRTARQKGRSGTRSPPVVVTPAAPVRSAPPAPPPRASNSWESPTSTGFNQK